MRFPDRTEAGRLLAQQLERYSEDNVIVLGIPRGGVPVAFEIARHLNAPLDICLVRKLRVPEHSELAMGAIASGGVLVLNEDVVGGLAIEPQVITAAVRAERRELERREKYLCGRLPTLDVCGRQLIVVDDGLATGASMRAAVQALRRMKPPELLFVCLSHRLPPAMT